MALPVKPVLTERPAKGDRVATLRLHNSRELPAIDESILMKGQLIKPADTNR